MRLWISHCGSADVISVIKQRCRSWSFRKRPAPPFVGLDSAGIHNRWFICGGHSHQFLIADLRSDLGQQQFPSFIEDLLCQLIQPFFLAPACTAPTDNGR